VSSRGGFRIDVSPLEHAADALEDGARSTFAHAAERTIPRMAEEVEAAVRVAAAPHRRTGKLASLIGTERERDAGIDSEATVRVAGRVAPIIVHGSRRHAIRARAGHALAFAGPPHGFASRVNHPGTRPDPFFARGVRAAEPSIDRIVTSSAEAIASELAELVEE
jgi:hypothetical protein